MRLARMGRVWQRIGKHVGLRHRDVWRRHRWYVRGRLIYDIRNAGRRTRGLFDRHSRHGCNRRAGFA
jgi:hypothetical protein